jgi:hypothetical protein
VFFPFKAVFSLFIFYKHTKEEGKLARKKRPERNLALLKKMRFYPSFLGVGRAYAALLIARKLTHHGKKEDFQKPLRNIL